MASTIDLSVELDISKVNKALDLFSKSLNSKTSTAGFDSLQSSLDRTANAVENINSKTTDLKTDLINIGTLASGTAAGFVLFSSQIENSAATLGNISKAALDFSTKIGAFGNLGNFATPIKNALVGVSETLLITEKSLVQATSGITKLSQISVFSKNSIFGVQLALASVAAASTALTLSLSGLESSFARAIRTVAVFVAAISGFLAIAISQSIVLIGDFIGAIGTDLVNANIAAVNSFSKLEKNTLVFNRTVENFNKVFDNSVGTIESWNEELERIGAVGRVATDEMRKIGTEVISVGSNLGLSRDQMIQLTEAVIDFSKSTGKDAFDTSVAFLQAINGNTQSVVSYGVKLSEANLQHFLFKKGLDGNVSSMSEAQKIQLRYNAILDQYSRNVKGSAAAVAGTLLGAQERLDFVLKKVNQEYGRGAALIENWNLLTYAAATAVESVNSGVISAAGFIGALAGRVLQAGGLFLEWSFKILGVIKVLSLLDGLLQTGAFQNILLKNIPIINQSFIELIKNSGATFVSFNSLADVFKTFGSLTAAFVKNILASVAGLSTAQAASLSFANILRASLANSLSLVTNLLGLFTRALLSLAINPVVIGVAALSAAFYVLFKALVEIENRTGFFAGILDSIKQAFNTLSPVTEYLAGLFEKIATVIADLASKGFGLLIFSISKLILMVQDFVANFSFFKKAMADTKGVDKQKSKLQELSDQLEQAGFDFRKLPDNAKKAADKVNTSFDLEKAFEALKKLKDELKNIGVSDLDLIKRQENERLKSLDTALKAGIIKEREYADLKFKINKDAQDKISEIQRKADAEAKKALEDKLQQEQRIATARADLVRSAASNPVEALFSQNAALNKLQNEPGIGQSEIDFAKFSQQIGASLGLAVEAISGKGENAGLDAATKTISSVIGSLANTLLPGIGGVVQQLFQVLSQGPQAVQALVDGFIKAVPIVINSIVQALPVVLSNIGNIISTVLLNVLQQIPFIIDAIISSIDDIILALATNLGPIIEALLNAIVEIPRLLLEQIPIVLGNLAQNLPGIIQKLVDDAPRIISELISKLPMLISGIVSQLPIIATQFAISLSSQAAFIAISFSTEFIKQMPKIAVEFAKALLASIKDGFKNIFSGFLGGGEAGAGIIGSIGKALGGVGKLFGFAEGGIIPSGFPNDTFPARLTSGERIVSAGENERLSQFLDRAESGASSGAPQNLTVNLMIGEEQLANVILQLNQRGFRLA